MADMSERKYRCKICSQRFLEHSYLKTHLKKHAGENEFECGICLKSFPRKGQLEIHMRIHTGERPFSCKICSKTFAAKGYLNSHLKLHDNEKMLKCEICLKSFVKNSLLEAHMRRHTGERPYCCQWCSKTFIAPAYLRDHLKYHEGPISFKCPTCNKAFLKKFHLESHLRTHTGEKPFLCHLCPKMFSAMSYLKEHINYHNGLNTFTCDTCSKVCLRKGELIVHMRCHNRKRKSTFSVPLGKFPVVKLVGTKEKAKKKLSCQHCSKTFFARSCLVEHFKKSPFCSQINSSTNLNEGSDSTDHVKNNEYSCVNCSEVFSSQGCLETHMKSHLLDLTPPKNDQSIKTKNDLCGRGFICSFCPKKLSTRAAFIAHEKCHTLRDSMSASSNEATSDKNGFQPNGCHQCSVCLRKFSFKLALLSHERAHLRKKRLSIPDKSPSSHPVSVIPKDLPPNSTADSDCNKGYSCATCSKNFTSIQYFIRHITKHHFLRLQPSIQLMDIVSENITKLSDNVEKLNSDQDCSYNSNPSSNFISSNGSSTSSQKSPPHVLCLSLAPSEDEIMVVDIKKEEKICYIEQGSESPVHVAEEINPL